MAIGALLTWDDRAVEGLIITGEGTPIGWAAYARFDGCDGECGSARQIGR